MTGNLDPQQQKEWLESLDAVLSLEGPETASSLLGDLQQFAQKAGLILPVTSRTSYVNSIRPSDQPTYPGDLGVERHISGLVRWNALAMVVRANRIDSTLGGHIVTFTSCADIVEVGNNHFFRGRQHPCGGDHVYFQGHATPGIYARAFMEGFLEEENLIHFRREVLSPKGLSSYPHPWLMPEMWEFPTVSMGLGPLQAIYRARYMHYLENRGLKERRGEKVWCFLGDGECDEPETLGSITLASREKLDNLIFVINCNLQRLDGPVRGNGKIIQELEAIFRGCGWNVIKVLWGTEWDDLLARDTEGYLEKRFNETVDGEYQRYRAEGPAYIREHFFGAYPELARLVENMSDEDIWNMRRGGHDPVKVHAAYAAAMETTGAPTVILVKTVKGFGMGEIGEGKNVAHQTKKLKAEDLLHFRDRFEIPLTDEQTTNLEFCRPKKGTPEYDYLKERRAAQGGFVPARPQHKLDLGVPPAKIFEEFHKGTPKPVATTMAMVGLLTRLLGDKEVGKNIVPIVPDEARTFGMDALFRKIGIYSDVGQLYEPVDKGNLMYYRESKDGQLLEEGITEAGAMCSFIAAGTSHTYHGVPTIPMYFFYSMFGFQRIADLIWAAGDARTRGFLLGCTAGGTTLAGEGLQHLDGHSHVFSQAFPAVVSYDPAFAYEISVIVREGLRRMTEGDEDLIYYLTVYNETYEQPPMPKGVEDGILRGMYLYKKSPGKGGKRIQLLGSGPILNEVLKAQDLLKKEKITADVWSVTSYTELRRDALEVERWNLQNPGKKARTSYLESALAGTTGPFVAASDYMKAMPDGIARWLPGKLISLGTDGFGRSDNREQLRKYFEVDAGSIVRAAKYALK